MLVHLRNYRGKNSNINMMWASTFLYILGINIYQATGQAKSTQMYYVKLIVDKSAFGNITDILKSFVSNSALQVEDLQMTTTCEHVSELMECTCKPGYIWSDKTCESDETCCGDSKCTFSNNSAQKCVSNNAVTIKGSFNIKGTYYQDCLADKKTQEFQNCNNKMLREMKMVYSTLRGFEALHITKYSVGDVIVDFEMTVVTAFDSQTLIEKSENLTKFLLATFNLETTGLVHISMPQNPVKYNAAHTLICTIKEDLNIMPEWQLRTHNQQVSKITNGTVSQITTWVGNTTLQLSKITEVWAGVYTCAYPVKTDSYTITHTARAVLDIALLPNIDITTVPQFPRCQNKEDLLNVKSICEIRRSTENYTVTWSSQDRKITIISVNSPLFSEETVVYSVEAVVGCNISTQKPLLTCTFLNRRNQSASASVNIDIIYVGEQFCTVDKDWDETKAGHTAVLKCLNEDGKRYRKCNGTTWEQEEPKCVNRGVNSLLQSAHMVDIGIGELDENAAQVFSRLNKVTNNTMNIGTFSNINATVVTISILSDKLNRINNDSTVNDFLDSSSNLMNKSLEESWKGRTDDGNFSLAETYLSSFEKLIEAANINDSKKKTNIEVATCYKEQGSICTNKVFNATVNFDSLDIGHVKTAGFQQLENYLPNKDDKYKPNSIIVSTITEKHSGSVNVEINFMLHLPRPKNVEIKCVSWDNTTNQWSTFGCAWKGPSTEGSCVCSHLSSFAILMAREPLEMPWMTEITYLGLSISVVSLVISLVIEMTMWNMVVKTNTLYLRHTAHINISLCLLIAHCCFLASSKPQELSETWCKTSVVLKHFSYLSTFFWTLCLSSTLLHQAVFLFHEVSKKTYLRFSLILGYGCPFLIVTITFLSNTDDAKGLYFSTDTCWLVYNGVFKGSIHTFLIPIGIIIVVNLFSMLVVIMKLVDNPMNTKTSHHTAAAKTIMRTVVLLTPIFGVTWLFGFGVTILDLASGKLAFVANYVFVLLNSFQGLFILLTTCLGDKLTRDALLKCLKLHTSASITDSSTKFNPTIKK